MVDPNIRPSFISDPVSYRKRITQIMSLADIVKLSAEDVHWLFGPGKPTTLAKRVLQMGPKVVVITQGHIGAWALSAEIDVFSPPPNVNVVDTVGAGDTFSAGFLAALRDANSLKKTALEKQDADILQEAVSFGCKIAAISVCREGADPPWRHEL